MKYFYIFFQRKKYKRKTRISRDIGIFQRRQAGILLFKRAGKKNTSQWTNLNVFKLPVCQERHEWALIARTMLYTRLNATKGVKHFLSAPRKHITVRVSLSIVFLKFSCSFRVCRNICHLISSVDDTRQSDEKIYWA